MKNKIKVLNISTSRLGYNGVGIVLLNYYKNIKNNELVMDYLAPDSVEEGFKKEITFKGNKLFEFGVNGKKMRQVRPLKYCMKLYEILKREKYDIVHVHGSSSMMFLDLITAKLAGVKIRIAHCHNTKSDYDKLHKLLKPIFKNSYTHAFACGKKAGEFLFGAKENFTIIPNGKKMELYEFNGRIREEYRKKYNIDEEIVIGHVGNFNEQKNHEYLIDIFDELVKDIPGYKLLLIGGGALMEQIKKKVERLDLTDKVIFTRQLPVDVVAKMLSAMDIMVFPSKFEGFPNVLIEWQIAGLPCLISDKITKDVKITNLVNFLSIDDEPKIWAKKIKDIVLIDRNTNRDIIKKQVGEAGFDIRENAKNLEETYIRLVEEVN